MIRLLTIFICFLNLLEVLGQAPEPAFEVPTTPLCLGAQLELVNTSINASDYLWDFCPGDLNNTPSVSNLATLTGASTPTSIKTIEYNGNWYAFAVSFSSNKLFRIDLGGDIINPASTINDFGNPDGLFNGSYSIDIVRQNDDWFGIVTNLNNSKLILLSFGNDLTNTPTASEIIVSPSSLISTPRGISIARDNNKWYALVGNISGTGASILNFGSDISTNPTGTTLATGGSSLGATFVFDQGNWSAYVINSNIVHLRFGNSLDNTPSINNLSLDTPITNGSNISVFNDAGNYIALLGSRTGNIFKLDLGNDLETNNATVTDLGNLDTFSDLIAIDGVKYNSRYTLFGINVSNAMLSHILFPQNCSSSIDSSNEAEPQTLSFSQAGNYKITLYAYDDNGKTVSTTQSMTVTAGISPEISFTVNISQCIANSNVFASSSTIADLTYSWDFNSDQIVDSTEPNPTYQFQNTGTYDVSLVVQATNGCSNNAMQQIDIYPEPPIPDFEIINASICSNSELNFGNLSDESAYPQEILSYTWDFDGVAASSETSPSFAFTSGGTKQVSLTMAIPGCETIFTKNIDITPGPAVAFEFVDECEGFEIQFDNQTSGDGITDYVWDFGDGFTNITTQPSHVYESAGHYDINLISTNDSGCVNSLTKTIAIHSIPVVSFSNEVGCENIPLQFTDASIADNANMSAWNWNFDGQGNSTERNPAFAFQAAGEYEVTLTAETNYGCLETISQMVVVNPSPAVGFEVTLGCLNEVSSFSDITTTLDDNRILAWYWEIDDQVYTTQHPTYTFATSGLHDVSLTVTPQNSCAITASKEINVEAFPVADFTITNNCDNEFTVFRDASTVESSPIVSRTWDLAGLSTVNGDHTSFSFPVAGQYDITLTVLNDLGCSNEITRTIEIFESPKAKFTVDVDFGAPPLDVAFTNNSSNASGYQWHFDDTNDSNSSEVDPTFTFNEVKDYNVELIALNDLGCSDTTYRKVVSEIPVLDLELVKLEPSLNNDKINLNLMVSNSGTIKIDGFTVIIDIEDDFSISETYIGSLNAGQEIVYPLNFAIPVGASNIGYLCIRLEDNFGETLDVNESNNEKCSNFDQQTVFEMPFPNPANDVIHVKAVLPVEADVIISLLNIHGKTVYLETFPGVSSGLNTFSLDLQDFKNGMYFKK